MHFNEIKQLILSSHSKLAGQGASEDEIVDAELQIGLCIHGDYRWFLREFGWGGVNTIEIYGLGQDVPAFLNLVTITLSERSEMIPRLRRTLLPIMNDGGGNLYCLDVDSVGPQVVFWDHEAGEDQIPSIVAGDFTSWLREKIKHSESS